MPLNALLGTFAVLSLSSAAGAQGSDLVIADVTVVSPERFAPLEHAYVRIVDGMIAEVSVQALSGSETVDGAGHFLIPGLIDTHTHLHTIPGLVNDKMQARPNLADLARAQIPRSYLFHGFTTVLDLGMSAEPLAPWNALDIRPDAYFCGKTPVFDGYSFEGPQANPYFLVLPEQQMDLPPGIDAADHTPEAVVSSMAADGASCVKAYMEAGFGAAVGTLPVPTVSMIQALVAAAHAHDMPVYLHANSVVAQMFAIEAGVDVIAHGMWNGHDPTQLDLGPEVKAALREIAERGIGYQPTMRVLAGLAELFDPDFLMGPQLSDVTPPTLLEWYGTEEGGWFRREVEADIGGPGDPRMNDGGLRRGAQVLQALANLNARLLFGTDTPAAPTYANPPGLNGRLEMQRWIDAGLSETQLFRAMTLDNAAAMGLENEIGTVEAGKVANLLLLRANPLDSIAAYDGIEVIFLRGRPILRMRLSALALNE